MCNLDQIGEIVPKKNHIDEGFFIFFARSVRCWVDWIKIVLEIWSPIFL